MLTGDPEICGQDMRKMMCKCVCETSTNSVGFLKKDFTKCVCKGYMPVKDLAWSLGYWSALLGVLGGLEKNVEEKERG